MNTTPRHRYGGPTLALGLAGLLLVLASWLAGTTHDLSRPASCSGRLDHHCACARAESDGLRGVVLPEAVVLLRLSLKLKAGSYPRGQRVVLRGMSVMSRTSTTVTIAAFEAQPCPPDRWCGATIQYYSLAIAWTGTARPAYGAVIDLYGTSTGVSLTPVGYLPNTTTCHVDWC